MYENVVIKKDKDGIRHYCWAVFNERLNGYQYKDIKSGEVVYFERI